jgi:DNA topoisomerase VI subunit B
MALIWSKMTTAGELVAYTSQKGKKDITFCRLDIDLNKNEPKVKLHEKLPNDGTVVSEMLHKSFPVRPVFVPASLHPLRKPHLSAPQCTGC